MSLEIANVFYAIGYAEHPSGSSGTFDILVDLGGLTPKAAIFFGMPDTEAQLQTAGPVNYPSLGFTDGTNHVCYCHGAEANAAYNPVAPGVAGISGVEIPMRPFLPTQRIRAEKLPECT